MKNNEIKKKAIPKRVDFSEQMRKRDALVNKMKDD